MTSNKAFENLTFYLSAKNAPEVVWEDVRQIEKELEILQIIKEHLHYYENIDDFVMYWFAGSSDSEWKKYNEEVKRKRDKVIEWWKEAYYPNYKKGE